MSFCRRNSRRNRDTTSPVLGIVLLMRRSGFFGIDVFFGRKKSEEEG
jgi:hypothetical protein